MKWATIVLSLIFISAITAPTFAEEATPKDTKDLGTGVLKEDFLGLHLGCSYDEVKKVIKDKPVVFLKETVDTEVGNIRYLYSGNHKLKGAKATLFSFWEERLHAVAVVFEEDDGEPIYVALKGKIEAKYGPVKDGMSFGKDKKCEIEKNGTSIALSLEDNFESNQVLLIAVHKGIEMARRKSVIEQKSDDLGEL